MLCFGLPTNVFHIVQSAVHRSFAVADNLGEVSAKAQVSLSETYSSFLCFYHIVHSLDFIREFSDSNRLF